MGGLKPIWAKPISLKKYTKKNLLEETPYPNISGNIEWRKRFHYLPVNGEKCDNFQQSNVQKL